MATRLPKGLPNPFYLVLIAASVVFTVTCFGYLVGPFVVRRSIEHPESRPGPGSLALAGWFDRHATTVLAISFVVMLISALLAMAADQWSSPARRPGQAPRPKAP
jgi:hypothetical protein